MVEEVRYCYEQTNKQTNASIHTVIHIYVHTRVRIVTEYLTDIDIHLVIDIQKWQVDLLRQIDG